MDVTQVARSQPSSNAADSCPRCGESWPASPPVTAPSFGGRSLRRCRQCGTRVANGSRTPHLVFTCETCGLPFLAQEILPHGARRCGSCVSGLVPPEIPDREVAEAAENEVRAALATHWRFVTSSLAQPYLDRMAKQVASRIPGSPAASRVVLIDTTEHRSLALPSGTLLISTGLLAFLDDEAELAFVLGHEIAHAASGEAAVRLVRLGFEATARERHATDGLCWSDAAVDLARLGYGRTREHDADAFSLAALIALDYEPQSACRYLQRLHASVKRGDEAVAETEVAHPTPLERLRRIERILSARIGATTDAPRVNREVFRRALPPASLAASLVQTHLDAQPPVPWGMPGLHEQHRRRILSGRVIIAVAIAATTLVWVAAWLAR